MTFDLQHIINVYFPGIGGIGMSALARYFNHLGKNVAGYDLTRTKLTDDLISEGIPVHFDDNISLIPSEFKKSNTLVVFTPAVPSDLKELNWLKSEGYPIYKRAQVLGMLCNLGNSIAVSGTHGKTTISTMTSVILKESSLGCGAFLGGISKNYNTNLILPETGTDWLVTEADEYDRSFLNLFPTIALVSAVDPDHLDIYGTLAEIKIAFSQFISQIKPGGKLVIKNGIDLSTSDLKGIKVFSYSLNEPADYFAENISIKGDGHVFDLVTPGRILKNMELNYPGLLNVENAVGAATLALEAGVSENEVRYGLSIYQGVRRRFDIRYRDENLLFIDDYAHHPKELEATITSVRKLYPGKKITGIFQPHLFSRTKDLADGFAQSLDLLDTAFILPIYPAREQPMEGVTSELIIRKMKSSDAFCLDKTEVINRIKEIKFGILITMGAGDIDKVADEIAEVLERRRHV